MEEETFEPASPSSQYLNSSNLSLGVIAVLEFKNPIEFEDSLLLNILKDVFVPVNPRFSSIMTINDVITGVVAYGTRLYMQGVNQETCNGTCTALVLFNTRALGGYKSVSDMIKPNSDMPWGNHYAILPVSLPKLTNNSNNNPLAFVQKAHRIIDRKRNSASIWLTGILLNFLGKLRGPEATARFIHRTLKNTSMGLSNLIGPVEEMALANNPVKGLYFVVTGAPQSYTVTMVSYVDKLRIAIAVKKDISDPNKLKSCIEFAFDSIFKAALNSSTMVK